jgi:hypothetical protein
MGIEIKLIIFLSFGIIYPAEKADFINTAGSIINKIFLIQNFEERRIKTDPV